MDTPGVVHRIHCINTGVHKASIAPEDDVKNNTSYDSLVQQEAVGQQSPPQPYARAGCGVKGCNRSACVVCTHIHSLSAEANLQQLAYEDEKDDLAAMDHGRPTFDNELQRTISDPDQVLIHIQTDSELKQEKSRLGSNRATLSGATGHELAREIRKYLETHDQNAIEHTKSGVCAHGRSTPLGGKSRSMMSDEKVIMSI
jgi:hypothetical protein